MSPTIKTHLALLSRLAFALRDKPFAKVVARKGALAEVLPHARRIDGLDRRQQPAEGGPAAMTVFLTALALMVAGGAAAWAAGRRPWASALGAATGGARLGGGPLRRRGGRPLRPARPTCAWPGRCRSAPSTSASTGCRPSSPR
ncbi:MAG: hypothetical protein MZU95_04670 [Desulfomicrobium escambiense]|nr:hypothetical protein [Desulfomicrobium escambiense]